MWRLRLYLSRILITRWLVAAVGLVILLGLLDSLANAGDIAASHEGNTFRYMYLRAPIIFDQIFIFSLMLALLLTFASLIRRNELVAIQGLGLSLSAQVRTFTPVVLLIAGASMVFIDLRVPPSVRALNAWGIGEYEDGTITKQDPLWLNDRDKFVSITGREGLATLTGLTFFQRDDVGAVIGVTWAERATYTGNGWSLEGVHDLQVDQTDAQPLTAWQTRQRPELIDRLAAEPRDLAIADLSRFEQLRGSGSRPSAAYRVWWLSRLSLPITAMSLLLMAVPMMQRLGRRDSGTLQMIVTLGLTFLFMVFDGIAKTVGAAGGLSPLLAAMGISVGFGLSGIYLALRQESLA